MSLSGDWRRDLLGVRRDASLDECKAAFRRRALELHPDVARSPASERRFVELSEAYQSLLNDSRPPATRDVPRSRGFVNAALRSRTTTLWLCGASLVGGVCIFAGV